MRGLLLTGLLVLVTLASAGQASSARPWRGRYTVRPGDSLTLIGRHYRVSVDALARANDLDPRKPLIIGVVLRVPSRSRAIAVGRRTYLVRGGDTLSAIADRYHLSIAELAAANGLDPAGVLLAGARLTIPAGSATAVTLLHVAETDPYRRGTVGYDVSYPNCSARPAGAFAVIGLNAGRPFTANPCFAREWRAGGARNSVYVNTAYDAALLRYASPNCLAAGRRQRLRPAAQRAFALGCSEAEYDLRLLGGTTPVAVWLDVELGNAWSTRRSLNAATVRGVLIRLLDEPNHLAVGVYSSPALWRAIVGRWTSLTVPEWIAPSAPDPPGCPRGFASGPVWLSQTTDGRLDRDTGC